MTKQLIVTGASRGIGYATAKYFVERQWQVVNLSRKSCDLKNVQNMSVNLANIDEVERAAEILIKKCEDSQQICLLHNACSYALGSITQIDINQLQEMLNVTILSTTRLTQFLLPHLPSASAIIFIGSTLSEKAVPNNYCYIIAKHAVVGMMRALVQDIAGKHIHACCICPGFTDTEMLYEHFSFDEKRLMAAKAMVGDNRFIQPEEIASLIYYSTHNPIINGAIVHANLGQIGA